MFRIATILIILSLAGSEVNCGLWPKGFKCFSSGCNSVDVAPGPSKRSALNPAAESSIAATGPPLSNSAPSSSSVDTKIDNEFKLPEQEPEDLSKITVVINGLPRSCEEIDTNRRDHDHWIYVHSCLKEIVTEIDNYKSSSIDDEILKAFNRMSIFDSLYNEESTFEQSSGPISAEMPYFKLGKKFEAHCLEGKLEITYPHWWYLSQHVSEEKGLVVEHINEITKMKYHQKYPARIEMENLFDNSCDLIDNEKPLNELLVAARQFLEEAQRLVGLSLPPKKESQCNVRLMRYLTCRKVKEWGKDLLSL